MATHEFASADDRINKLKPAKMWDQHGRKYSTLLDNGFPVAQGPRPDGWRAPWMPSQEWFRYGEDQENPLKFRIAYEEMLEARVASHEAYDAQWTEFAVANGWDPEDKDVAGRIIAKVGKRPLPVEIIVAAIQGNKYVLGLTDKVDPRITPFLNQRPRYKRQDKLAKVVSSMDFSDHDEDEPFEERMDLQDEFDPEATPRGIAPMKPKNKGGRPKKQPDNLTPAA